MYGGVLAAGPEPGGGFAVRAQPSDRAGDAVIRVLVVDDQALVRGGFRLILESQPDLEVVGGGGRRP